MRICARTYISYAKYSTFGIISDLKCLSLYKIQCEYCFIKKVIRDRQPFFVMTGCSDNICLYFFFEYFIKYGNFFCHLFFPLESVNFCFLCKIFFFHKALRECAHILYVILVYDQHKVSLDLYKVQDH